MESRSRLVSLRQPPAGVALPIRRELPHASPNAERRVTLRNKRCRNAVQHEWRVPPLFECTGYGSRLRSLRVPALKGANVVRSFERRWVRCPREAGAPTDLPEARQILPRHPVLEAVPHR
jgi:hypothetical protein